MKYYKKCGDPRNVSTNDTNDMKICYRLFTYVMKICYRLFIFFNYRKTRQI